MTTPDAAPEPPVEQLAQQQSGPEPVAFASVFETAFVTMSGIKFHLIGVGVDGSLWERWSDIGQWVEILRPVR